MKIDALIKAAAAAAPALSNNKTLPELPAWQARSFWLTLVTGGVALANSQGADLLGIFRDMGLGASPDAVVDSAQRSISAVQALAPYVTGIWAYFERRAPNFRLTFWRRRNG